MLPMMYWLLERGVLSSSDSDGENYFHKSFRYGWHLGLLFLIFCKHIIEFQNVNDLNQVAIT